jgi:FAD/FMN-containing dehydrogenase/Fe-S oxidoreductase
MTITEQRRAALERHLRRHIQGEVRFDRTSRGLYSTDASIYQIEPLGVVIPRTAEDVQATLQIAAEMHVPITPRGGGTSLSGQSVGPGVMIDHSKYLNRILDIDPAGRKAVVQPGVVLDEFNRALAAFDLQFGPEVSTSSRANLGGMIGNNSAGSRSVVYGKTIDHVRQLNVILADGTRTSFTPLRPAEWDKRASGTTPEAALYRQVRQIVLENAQEIRRRFPRLLRRVSGYNLDVLCDFFTGAGTNGDARAGLHQLIIGSEGTLALITSAELNIIPRPKNRGLLVVHYSSLGAAMDTTAACLEMGPSAVELMDRMLIDLARGSPAIRDTMTAIRGSPAAVFMVEFHGDDQGDVADRVVRLQKRLAGAAGVEALVPALDAGSRDPLWNLRKSAVPLLFRLPGDRKPIAFVEDTAVPPARLPEFVARFEDILKTHGIRGAYYGHASVGCLHIRPALDLRNQEDVALMRRVTEKVTDLVLEFNGSLSGEHGDGLARSEWNRKMFGDAVYEAFRQVKRAFDPEGLLNPGKIVDAPPMTDNLRYGPHYKPIALPTLFDYSKQEGFTRAVELCNGSGACRKLKGGTMCPSFRATLDEKDNTRGRANALRLALSSNDPRRDLQSQDLYDVLDLCLMCKACKTECPSNVDLAKLKAEFLHLYYERHPRPLGHRLLANVHLLNRFGAWAAPLVNWLQARPLTRWLLERAGGIDRRRSLPELHAHHFHRWFARHRPAPTAGEKGTVVLLDDCFTTYNEPDIGRAAVTVLEAAGYRVELAGLTCCVRPMLSKGFLVPARALVRQQAPPLARRLRFLSRGKAEPVPVLGLEPSCLSALVEEWPDLLPGDATKQVAASVKLADAWLAEQVRDGRCELPLAPRPGTCLLHGHCHQKAMFGVKGSVQALQLVPELKVTALDSGCCGMAGSFGFEREHFDLSERIANLELLPALRAEPEALVAAPGTSCRHQIKDFDGRRALHPLEVLAEQLVNRNGSSESG